MLEITRETGLVNEEYRGEFWDITLTELLQDYQIMLEEGFEMDPKEAIEEFEDQHGFIHPDTVRGFFRITGVLVDGVKAFMKGMIKGKRKVVACKIEGYHIIIDVNRVKVECLDGEQFRTRWAELREEIFG